jgi:hypothetical protein
MQLTYGSQIDFWHEIVPKYDSCIGMVLHIVIILDDMNHHWPDVPVPFESEKLIN